MNETNTNQKPKTSNTEFVKTEALDALRWKP